MNAQALAEARMTDHAAVQLPERGIDEASVRQVLALPDKVISVGDARVIAQKRLFASDSRKTLLYRVVVDMDRCPAEIVTAY